MVYRYRGCLSYRTRCRSGWTWHDIIPALNPLEQEVASMQSGYRYVLLIVLASVGSAQLDQGQIAGTVTDSTQAIVAGAKVIAVSDATGRAQTTQTGANGSFVLTNLQVG